jgi:hypothetical protein
VGVASDPVIGRKLAEQSVHQGGWGNTNRAYDERYVSIVENAWQSRSCWFADEFDRLWEGIANVWRQNLGNYATPDSALKRSFDQLFLPAPKAVLVPAKRKLETTKPVNSSEVVQNEGTGILNFLFMAKNQSESATARKQFDMIAEAFEEITQGFKFQVFLRENTQVDLQFRQGNSQWIPAANCGLGLQEVLMTLYLGVASDHDVVLIEEPENHLHPAIQRRLFTFLLERTERQFFLSTHSSVFLNPQLAGAVFLCRFDDAVTVQNATSRALVLAELGYSIADNLVSDVIVLCEGPTDKLVLEELFQKQGLSNKLNVKIWPLGGDIMDQLDLSVFSQSYKVIALIDNDPGSSAIRKRFLETCGKLGIQCHRLQRYALENYLSIRAIKEIMGESPNKIEKLDPNKPVAGQLGYQVKRNGGRIAKAMNLDEIDGSDLGEFIDKVSKL